MNTFRNPLADFDTPDPFITYDKETGYYYSLFTRHEYLELFRSKHLGNLIREGESRIIYRPNGEKEGIWGDIWAPEMHKGSDGGWYIYTSEENRRARLKASRGYSDEKIDSIFSCQLSEEAFRAACQEVIDNNGSREETFEQIDKALENAWCR